MKRNFLLLALLTVVSLLLLYTCKTFEPKKNEDCKVRNRAILTTLYDATGGDQWRSNENWKSEKHLDVWGGVGVNAKGFVIELLLDYNNLTGTIPSNLDNIKKMTYFHLSSNAGLTGSLPSNWCDLAQKTIDDTRLTCPK